MTKLMSVKYTLLTMAAALCFMGAQRKKRTNHSVYRVYKEGTDRCHYKIEFGNGDVIDMDKDVSTTGFWDIKAAYVQIEMSENSENNIQNN